MVDCPIKDDDFNFRTPTNNASMELKKKAAIKNREPARQPAWVGYKCKSCYDIGSRPGSMEFTKCPTCHSSNIEKFDPRKFWQAVKKCKCELEGPYECPWCGGHIMLDATFLDQVASVVVCPYCENVAHVKEV